MRQDCRFFASRVYETGDSMRTCELDLAPEAPWRCPADCAGYRPRLSDVGWQHGSLVPPRTPAEPPGLDEPDRDVAALLDEAEAIVSGAAEVARSEAEQEWQRQQRKGRLRRLFRRDR